MLINDILGELHDLIAEALDISYYSMSTLLTPLDDNDTNMTCFTTVDLNNTHQYSINKELYEDDMKIPCIYSKLYKTDVKERIRKPLYQRCKKCEFSLSKASGFILSISLLKQANFDKQTILDIVGIFNKKYNINIKKCLITNKECVLWKEKDGVKPVNSTTLKTKDVN